MKRLTSLVVAVALVLAAGLSTAQATVYYWDRSDGVLGANPGGPNFGDGIWDTALLNWNTNPDGSGSNVAWVNGNDVVFSAGSDLVGATTPGPPAIPYDAEVTITGTVTATSALIEEGAIRLKGGTLDTGAGAVTVNAGASLIVDSTSRLNTGAGKVVLNGGTFINANTGNAGSFLGTGANTTTGDGGGLKALEINGIGYIGYNDLDGTPDNKVSVFSGVINGTGGTTTNGGAGTLVKIGPDQVGIGVSDQDFTAGAPRIHSQSLFTFAKLIVKQGGYRLRNGTQDGTVRETAFGAVPLAELADAITLDGGGIGTNTTVTLHANRGITVLNSAGNELGVLSGDAALGGGYLDHGAGASLVIPGPLSGAGNLYVGDPTSAVVNSIGFTLQHANNVNTFTGAIVGVRGTLTLSSSLKVKGLRDVTGFTQNPANNASISVASGQTLTVGTGNGTDTWSRPITGAGKLTKVGSGTQSFTGAPTYTGNTAVEGGTLSISSAYLADAADVLLSTGSIFNLNFAGTDAMRSLLIDNVVQSAGIWGGIGSGAAHETALITGTGLLNASTGPVVGLPGDFNSDGKVDAGDYGSWRKNDTANLPLANDNGVGNQAARYTLWRANFGNPPGAGSSLNGGAVPEPGTLALAIFGLLMGIVGGRRR